MRAQNRSSNPRGADSNLDSTGFKYMTGGFLDGAFETRYRVPGCTACFPLDCQPPQKKINQPSNRMTRGPERMTEEQAGLLHHDPSSSRVSTRRAQESFFLERFGLVSI